MFRVYKPGDRIEINAIKDVLDINNVFTTLMEIGEWVSIDNYSGRIVKISNAFVFLRPHGRKYKGRAAVGRCERT